MLLITIEGKNLSELCAITHAQWKVAILKRTERAMLRSMFVLKMMDKETLVI